MLDRLRPGLWLLSAAFLGLATSAVSAAPRRVVVTPALCKPTDAVRKQWLPPDWQRFLGYTYTCTIPASTRKPALLLISVRADAYYKNQPGTTVEQVMMPRPLLFSPAGSVLGSLPYNFPDDPPTRLRVTFSGWVNGFPNRIELFLKDPAALGDRSLPPLLWDENQKKFLPGKE